MITLTRTQASIARNTFIGFMMRAGSMDRVQAGYEFDNFLMATPFKPTKQDYYMRVFREGSTVRLNRMQRQSVYLTFENALNHATF